MKKKGFFLKKRGFEGPMNGIKTLQFALFTTQTDDFGHVATQVALGWVGFSFNGCALIT